MTDLTRQTFSCMRQRCLNPKRHNYPKYGGAGIKICERWSSFANFLADMGPRPLGHTLDRINPDGDYEPGNCRWATQTEQQHNRRDTRLRDTTVVEIRRRYAAGGVTLKQLGDEFGMTLENVHYIVKRKTWK